MDKNDYNRAYQRGYVAGSRRAWPKHRPPAPPDGILRRIVESAQAMRDAIDAQLALFDEEDEMAKAVSPSVDSFDEAMIEMTNWLKQPSDHSSDDRSGE